MTYCMFENTVGELSQCIEAMEQANDIEALDLNDYEQPCYDQLAEMCKSYIQEYDRLSSSGEEE